MQPSDAALVVRALASDDRNAFAEIVRRHQSNTRALLRRLTGDAALADDLAQETFVRAWRALAQWRGDAKFGTWLYRIAYRVYASEAAKLARRATEPVAEPEMQRHETAAPPMESTHGADAARSDARRDLERAMTRLSAMERAVVVLTYRHDVTNEEAAEILDCPVGTVKTHLHRAKLRLKEMLTHV